MKGFAMRSATMFASVLLLSSLAPVAAADEPLTLATTALDRITAGAEINGSAFALGLGSVTRADTRTAGLVTSREYAGVPGATAGTASVATFASASAANGTAVTDATTSATAPEGGGSQLRFGSGLSLTLPGGFSSSYSASTSASYFRNPLLR
jgi:hypothetical protein